MCGVRARSTRRSCEAGWPPPPPPVSFRGDAIVSPSDPTSSLCDPTSSLGAKSSLGDAKSSLGVVQAAAKLVSNHTAIVRFAARGAGTKGSRSVRAPLADPSAIPADDLPSVDAALRHVAHSLLVTPEVRLIIPCWSVGCAGCADDGRAHHRRNRMVRRLMHSCAHALYLSASLQPHKLSAFALVRSLLVTPEVRLIAPTFEGVCS